MVFTLRVRPRLIHMSSHNLRIDVEEGSADILGKREVSVPIVIQVIKKYTADTTRLVAMREIEIAIAPSLELFILIIAV